MLVVDASIIVKAIVAESGSDTARTIVAHESELFVPAHCFAEVGETLARKIRTAQAVHDQAERALAIVFEPFTQAPLDGLLVEAIRLSNETGASVYDCLYVVLAGELDCPFVTADRKLIAKMTTTRHAPLMRGLDSFTGSP